MCPTVEFWENELPTNPIRIPAGGWRQGVKTVSESGDFLAVDLGASNGRVIRGRLVDTRLTLDVVHRFEHGIRFVDGHARWDWPSIRAGFREGLRKAVEARESGTVVSISCSAWAQDFGLLDAQGRLVYSPVSYRDARFRTLPDRYFDRICAEDLVQRVGVNALPFVTLCQLYVMAHQERDVLQQAATLLHMADLVHHDLCGVAATDWTLATASQLRNIRTGSWDRELLDMMDIPHHMLPPLIEQPAVLGAISRERTPHPDLVGVPVVLAAGHDTAAASAGAGILDEETLFLSEGTYAMLGAILNRPVISTDAVRAGCFLIGLAGQRWGLFAPVTGLWPMQECCRFWNRSDRNVTYDVFTNEMEAAQIHSMIPLAHPRFRAPENMTEEICQACIDSGQEPPVTRGEFGKVIVDSMVREHCEAVDALQRFTGRHFRCIRIVSGGSRNRYFCQKLADVLGIPVVAGPAESTAIGNIMLQAQVTGTVASAEQAGEILQRSLGKIQYVPGSQRPGTALFSSQLPRNR